MSYIVWSWLDWFMISCMVKPQYIVWSWLEWFMISCMVKPQGYIIYKVIMTGLIHDIMHGQASRVVSHIMIMTGLVHDWIGSWYHAWSSLKAVWHFMIMTGLVHDIMHGQASRLFDILWSGLDWIMMCSNTKFFMPAGCPHIKPLIMLKLCDLPWRTSNSWKVHTYSFNECFLRIIYNLHVFLQHVWKEKDTIYD